MKIFSYANRLSTPVEAFDFKSEEMVFPIKPHWHYYCELMYIISGVVSVNCDGKNYNLGNGDIMFIHPRVTHSVSSRFDNDIEFLSVKFDINQLAVANSYAPKLSEIFRKAQNDHYAFSNFSAASFKDVPMEKYFLGCIRETNDKNYGYDIQCKAYICNILIELIRTWRDNGFGTDITEQSSAVSTVQSITEYIAVHSDEQLKVEEIAEKCEMSYSYFAKCFRDFYGQSCKDYIETIRVSKAEDMLLFTNHDLSYISKELGFSDCSHLIKVFKKHKGITPKQFRLEKNMNKQSKRQLST